VKALRALIRFAKGTGECKDDPTAGVTVGKLTKSAGFLAWDGDIIARYRAHHAIGTMARLALELALNIAARREDLHVIGRQHLTLASGKPCITWRPSKTSRSTGKVLTIRILPELQEALDAMPKTNVLATAFLTTSFGKPFASAAALGNAFADWVKVAGLAGALPRRRDAVLSPAWAAQGLAHSTRL
jgi:integrase/recombinase XerD